MPLQDILKSTLRKGFLTTGLFGSLLLGCNGDDIVKPPPPPPPPPENQAPNTAITHQFRDDGRITYTFSGTDSDGSIDYISVRINGGASQNLINGSSKLIDIIEGTNRVKATAYDNKGLADPTPVEYSFASPTETQAKEIIAGILNTYSSQYKSFEKNVLLSLGASDSFSVDFLITTTDDKNAVINYIGYRKNLTEELVNQRLLNTFGIPNRYFVRIPESEISSRIGNFANNGFN